MNKITILLLAAFFVFVGFELSSPKVAVAIVNHPALIIANATPKPKILPKIERIELEENEIIIPCPPSTIKNRPKASELVCGDIETYGLIPVKTTVSNPKNDALTYYYKTSGGRIDGEGEKVVWNLQGVLPGDYTIFVQIGSPTMFYDESITQTVTIRECVCCIPDCFCPTLTVTGGGEIKAGETMDFTANISGGMETGVTYKWRVSQGEIIEGQDTPQIKVKTSSGMSGEIIATVEISISELCAECPKIAFETGTIAK